MDNLRGAMLMVLSMLFFALEDMFIKLMAETLPVGEILIVTGLAGAAAFSLFGLARGQCPLRRAMFWGPSGLRVLFEGIAGLFFVTALAVAPISIVTTIIQATPLIVTLGAALILREPVGPRRWTAIVIGLLGVLIVLRPFGGGFEATALFAVAGVLAMSARDLVTRRLPAHFTTLQMSTVGFLAVIPGGVLLLVVTGDGMVWPTPQVWVWLAAGILSGLPAIYTLIAAMRIGEISFVAPYRYSRIIFGLTVGALVFNETLDAYTLIGAAIIVASGIYMVWRERKLRIVAPVGLPKGGPTG